MTGSAWSVKKRKGQTQVEASVTFQHAGPRRVRPAGLPRDRRRLAGLRRGEETGRRSGEHARSYVSRRFGYANITTTLNTYTHLFDYARNAEAVKQRLEEEFGAILSAPS